MDAIHSLGRSWLVPEPELARLQEQLKAGRDLPPPDLGLLRTRPDEALEAVQALIAVDGKLADSEKAMTQEIKSLLEESG